MKFVISFKFTTYYIVMGNEITCCKCQFMMSVFGLTMFYWILFSMPWMLQMLMRSCSRIIRRSTSGETLKDQVMHRDMFMLFYVIFIQYCYIYIYTLSTLKCSFCNTGKCVSDFLIYIIFDNNVFFLLTSNKNCHRINSMTFSVNGCPWMYSM